MTTSRRWQRGPSDGTTAEDGRGRNSPFTTALLTHIASPGVDVRFLFARVRDDVMVATHGKQQPFIYQSLPSTEIFLKPPANAVAGVPSVLTPPVDPAERAWAVTKDTTSIAVLEDFVRQGVRHDDLWLDGAGAAGRS